jgi:hypothetical protein
VQSPAAGAAFHDALTEPTPGEPLLAELTESGPQPALVALIGQGDHAAALDLILDEIVAAPAERRDLLRQIALAIFDELGPEDPVTQAHRRRLATVLF